VLTDKRHVLTKDSNGHVQLWDVLAGQPIQQLGQVRTSVTFHFIPLHAPLCFVGDLRAFLDMKPQHAV
jgi:hypothetical protein